MTLYTRKLWSFLLLLLIYLAPKALLFELTQVGLYFIYVHINLIWKLLTAQIAQALTNNIAI